jgi:predicted MPP superfamily phosphohydrolase
MGLKFDLSKLNISNIPLSLPRLPSEFNEYRIVQISDFHLGTWLKAEELLLIVDQVNKLEPDLVAITGDFVSDDPRGFRHVLIQALSQLQPKDASVAVLGNHDHYTDPDSIRGILRESRIIDLSNQVHSIQRNSARLYLAGIDDYIVNKDNLERVLPRIPEGSLAILLAHEPDFADISAQSGKFDLQLSGHSHGGQICLPVLGPLFLPPHGRRYPAGEYRINGMVLYTNRGLGTSWLRIRYNCSPEISTFTLNTPSGDE